MEIHNYSKLQEHGGDVYWWNGALAEFNQRRSPERASHKHCSMSSRAECAPGVGVLVNRNLFGSRHVSRIPERRGISRFDAWSLEYFVWSDFSSSFDKGGILKCFVDRPGICVPLCYCFFLLAWKLRIDICESVSLCSHILFGCFTMRLSWHAKVKRKFTSCEMRLKKK